MRLLRFEGADFGVQACDLERQGTGAFPNWPVEFGEQRRPVGNPPIRPAENASPPVAGGARCFLVAGIDRRVKGVVIGEVRGWEFGSPPCDRFRAAGLDRARTMLARGNTVIIELFGPASPGPQAGEARQRVLDEIDAHAAATFRSIALSTMLKPMGAPARA